MAIYEGITRGRQGTRGPMSLTSVLFKRLKRITRKHLVNLGDVLATHLGFLAGTTHIAGPFIILYEVKKSLDEVYRIKACSMDFINAFRLVSHHQMDDNMEIL